MAKGYTDVGDGWIFPDRNDFSLACCDCGLAHKIKFRIVRNTNGGKSIEFKIARQRGPRVRFIDNKLRK